MADLNAAQRKKIDLSYAAGFLDADGSFILERRKDLRQFFSISHTPRICASGIEIKPLYFLKEIFGGHISKQRHLESDKRGLKSNYLVYQWSITGRKAVIVARLVMPYLKIKGVQSYLLSCFEYESLWSKGGKPEDARMPLEEFIREKI